ncbi:MAG: hypothetical protein AAF587_09775 [Bacteroidota bacterium]
MKNKPHLQVSSKPSVSTQTIAIYASGALVLAASIFGLIKWNLGPHSPPNGIKEYYFSPLEDNFYENPSNWLPDYPGTKIESGTKIIIQGLAYITHYQLEVLGEIQVSMDGMLFSSDGGILVSSQGKVSNEGELVLKTIDNRGELNNQMSATINVHELTVHTDALTNNLQGATMTINKRLLNQGSFNNYGHCNVQMDFDNQADFNQIRGGALLVNGMEVEMEVEDGI